MTAINEKTFLGMASAVKQARDFAFQKHGHQYDKGDEPYTLHLEYVAMRVPLAMQPVAWLHDVVEDTDVTIDEVRERFGDVVADAVDCITKRKGEEYGDYLVRVKSNPLAREVKIIDLLHNMDLNRLKRSVRVDDAERVRKYAGALAYLLG